MSQPDVNPIIKSFEEYFERITIDDDNDFGDLQKHNLLRQYFSLFGIDYKLGNIDKSIQTLYDKIYNMIPQSDEPQDWFTCHQNDSRCKFEDLKRLITKEIHSTYYMINILTNSVIPAKEKLFKIKVGDIPFEMWKEEKDHIQIELAEHTKHKHQFLIYAAGPTGSGKTFWLENLVKMGLKSTKLPNFPPVFFNIDGGRYRELSLVYRLIVCAVRKKNWKGMKNLTEDLFKSGDIKKMVKNFIKEKNKFPSGVSLITPETLSEQIPYINDVYKRDRDLIPNATIIYSVIFRHWNQCKLTLENFKCVGTRTAGNQRAVGQGKKFPSSNHSSKLSMTNSLKILRQNYRTDKENKYLIIHNTGKQDHISVILDLSYFPLFPGDQPKIIENAIYFNEKALQNQDDPNIQGQSTDPVIHSKQNIKTLKQTVRDLGGNFYKV